MLLLISLWMIEKHFLWGFGEVWLRGNVTSSNVMLPFLSVIRVGKDGPL